MKKFSWLLLFVGLFFFGVCESRAEYSKPIDLYPATGGYFGFGQVARGLYHIGADFYSPVGSNVYAVQDGRVIYSKEAGGFGGNNPSKPGGAIVIQHEDNNGKKFYALYGHLNRILANNTSGSPGDFVRKGQKIGTIREYYDAGRFWPHLHFGIYDGSGTFPSYGWGYASSTAGWHDPKTFLDNNLGPMQEPWVKRVEVSVTAPLSGRFQKGNSFFILWSTQNASFSDNMSISMKRESRSDLQTPDGVNFIRFTSGTPNNGFFWDTVPLTAAEADDWRVYVKHNYSREYGYSERFSVIPRDPSAVQVAVSSPSGGTFQDGDALAVHWSTANADPGDRMSISMKRESRSDLQVPDGINFIRFASGTPNDGYFSGTVPLTAAEADDWRVYVKHNDSSEYGFSERFSVIPRDPSAVQVAVSSPSGGTFQDGDALAVRWDTTNAGSADQMSISMKRESRSDLQEPDGVNFVRFTPGTANDGSYSGTVPPTAAEASDWRIYVKHNDSGEYGYSEQFSVTSSGSPIIRVGVTSPTGGTFPNGYTFNVRWNTTNADLDDLMSISMKRETRSDLQEPDGVNFVRFASGTPNDGSFFATVPPTAAQADDWRIYVKHNGSGQYGYSGRFSVTSSGSPTVQVNVSSPSGGTFRDGDTLGVQWDTTNATDIDQMSISMKRESRSDLQTPDGVNFVRFTSGTPNDGSFSATVPSSAAEADDWRIYVKHNDSEEYGYSVRFSVSHEVLSATVEMRYLHQHGVIDLESSNPVPPEATDNRATFTHMIVQAIESVFGEQTCYGEIPFADVDPNVWYYEAVCKAYGLGLLAEKTVFDPGYPMVRKHAVVMIDRAMAHSDLWNLNESPFGFEPDYSDIQELEPWELEPLAMTTFYGVTRGEQNGQFAPNRGVLRSESAAFIFRLMTIPREFEVPATVQLEEDFSAEWSPVKSIQEYQVSKSPVELFTNPTMEYNGPNTTAQLSAIQRKAYFRARSKYAYEGEAVSGGWSESHAVNTSEARREGLVAHYPLNGNIDDVSGNGHHGIANNNSGETWGFWEAQCNQGWDSAGGNNFIAIPDDGSLSISGPLTISTWVQLGNVEGNHVLIYKTADPNRNADNYKLYLFEGRFRFAMENSLDDNDFFIAAEEPAQPGQWYHVAGVYDGNAMKLFIDGTLAKQVSVGSFIPYTGNADLIFGTNAFSSHSKGLAWSNAILDEVRLYNRALENAEIQAIAEPCANPPSTGDNTVSLLAGETELKTKDYFTVDVEIEGEDVYAAHVEVFANPEAFEMRPDSGNYVKDFFSGRDRFEIGIMRDYEAGKWIGALGMRFPAEPVTGKGIFARNIGLRVKPNIYGPQTISGLVTLTNADGEELGVKVLDANVTIDDGLHGGEGVISGTVTLPDGSPLAGVDVTISKGRKTYTVQTDENGVFRFEDLGALETGESYVVSTEYDGFSVEQEVDDVSAPTELAFKLIDTLLADLNKDGVVDIQDFTILASAYLTDKGDEGFDERADLTRDQSVDVSDLALLGSHWIVK